MSSAKKLFKALSGHGIDDLKKQLPNPAGVKKQIWEQAMSNYPLRPLGFGAEGNVNLSEEDRANHFHILGTTREGKSRFMEQLIRHDIDQGYGLTLLDPSENGDTAHKVLKYCQAKGVKNVLWIDLNDCEKVVPTINPIQFKGPGAASSVVASVMDAVRVLWGQTNWADTGRIQTYLRALATVLYNAHATLSDAVYFLTMQGTGKYNPALGMAEDIRRVCLARTPSGHEARLTLEEVFSTRSLFLNEFKATIRRMTPFFDTLPALVFGSTKSPLDFNRVVADKMVLLVNLDTTGVGGPELRQLLGTVIVNELVRAIHFLRRKEWSGRHYLYIDEAAQFMTRSLADDMATMGKSGLWVTLAHQFYDQFEDKQVLKAVENLCKVKVMFYTPNKQDRRRMLDDLYWGELDASDAASTLAKQNAIVKVGKAPAQLVRIADVPDVEVPKADLIAYKEQIYSSNPCYRPVSEVEQEKQNRFVTRPNSATRPGGASVRNQKQNTQGNSPQPSGDSNPTEQARPAKQARPNRVIPRKPKGKGVVVPSFVHESPQGSDPVGGGTVEEGEAET